MGLAREAQEGEQFSRACVGFRERGAAPCGAELGGKWPPSWHGFRKDSHSPMIQVLSGKLLSLGPAVSGESHCHWALSLHCHSHTMLSGHRCEDLPQNVSSWLCSLSLTSLIPAPPCFNKRSHKSGVSPPILSQPSTFSHLISSLNRLEQARTPHPSGVIGIHLECQSRRWD